MARGRKNPTEGPALDQEFRGLWRDGRLLVIDLKGHRFPLRCLKSNQPVEPSDETVTLIVSNPPFREMGSLEQLEMQTDEGDAIAGRGSELDRGQVLDRGLVKVIHGQRSSVHVLVTLRLPLRSFWRRVMQWSWGARLVQVGAVGLVLLLGAAAWQFMLGRAGRAFTVWEFRVLLTSLSLVGIGWLIETVQQALLPIRRVQHGLLWLGGVHRDWLRGLPEFQPNERMLGESSSQATWELWTSIVLSAIFLGLIIGTVLGEPNYSRSVQIVIHGFLVFVAICLLLGNRARGKIQHLRRILNRGKTGAV